MKTITSISRAACPKTTAGRSRTACPTRLLPPLLLLLLALPAVVQAEDYTYTTTNGTITITGYSGSGGDVVIPQTINGLPVTRIGNSTFMGSTNVTSVVIPDTVTTIDDGSLIFNPFGAFAFSSVTNVTMGNGMTQIGAAAFFGCYNLATVEISDSVTRIGDGAFYSCTALMNLVMGNGVLSVGNEAFRECGSLRNLTIPQSLTSIGDRAFWGCGGLTAITVNPANPSYCSRDGVLFDKNLGKLIRYATDGVGRYIVPDGVAMIEDGAFSFNSTLTNVVVSDSVTNIGGEAFAYCGNLTTLKIGSGVTAIGDFAFMFCTSLLGVEIPIGVTEIGSGAFHECHALATIMVDPLNSAYSSTDGVLFDKAGIALLRYLPGKVGAYSMPEGVERIADEAFASSYELTSIVIPNSVTNIGEFAFACSGLRNLSLPDSVRAIGNRAFELSGLTNISLGKGLESIGFQCFFETGLTTVTIPKSVTFLGAGAFEYCWGLRAAYFEGNAPREASLFIDDSACTVYRLPGTTGWGITFDGRPTALWLLPYPAILTTAPNFGIQSNAFGFTISWATNVSVVVEASPTLSNPVWSPVSTNTLTSGSSYFSDPQWTNYPARFYRLRSP